MSDRLKTLKGSSSNSCTTRVLLNHPLAGLRTAVIIAASLLLASMPSNLKAQVTLGLSGTLYFGPHYPSFVTDQPCHSYSIDLLSMESVYPEILAKVEAFRPGPVDLIVSLQAVKSITPDGRSAFLVTSMTLRKRRVNDPRKLCTSETPGGYYDGVLRVYRSGSSWAYMVLGLRGDRQLYLDFSPKEPPTFEGKPLLCFSRSEPVRGPSCNWPIALKVGKTRVRVFLKNCVDPNGDPSQVPIRIELIP